MTKKKSKSKRKDLCLLCPDGIRGTCCFMNIPIGSFNIMLENVPCPYLDLEKMFCSDFEHRHQLAPWCLDKEHMFGKGGLPKGCLYLKQHPEKEPHPKEKIQEILPNLPHHQQLELVGKYNFFNNVDFMKYIEWSRSKEAHAEVDPILD